LRNPERSNGRILVVDDDSYLLDAICQTLSLHGYEVDSFTKPGEAVIALLPSTYMAVIADVKMPVINGLDFLNRVKTHDQALPVIMITGHGDIDLAVKAMKNGAYDFLEKPVDEDVLLASLGRAVEKMALVLDNRRLQSRLADSAEQRCGFQGLIGNHPLMQRLYDTIEIVARENDPVLISGETGVGKELVARAIHNLSNRRDKPFVAVNMGAIPAEMLEAELYGYEKGAFTGATQTKIGKFEFAGQGTIFLDEICSLPFHLQAKLLRVLEDRAITRLAANKAIPVQARIIAATNSDLMKEIETGRFRQDLFFRLNVLPIEVPPLRDRRSDIPLLAGFFCQDFGHGRAGGIFLTEETIRRLITREWQGNVRELKNHMRRLCVYGEGISSAGEAQPGLPAAEEEGRSAVSLRGAVEEAEKQHLVSILHLHKGQVTSACKDLEISRKCLYDKINKHGIELDSFRND
jgi:two-component system, NtrC family, C4-dicarboxylate transport response regulator DctD